MLFYCCTTADILTKHFQQCFLFFIVGNNQVSVYRTIGPTLVYMSGLKINLEKTRAVWVGVLCKSTKTIC